MATVEEKAMVVDEGAPAAEEKQAAAEAEVVEEKKAEGDDAEVMEKVKKQVEFYFADSNLPYDKFMWSLYSKDPEHWIPISTIASFKRMREYQRRGNDLLVSALRTSTFLELDETATKIRRKTEPKEPKDAFERSVYAKGFPEEDAMLQKRLEEYFSQFGKTNSVRMRRDEHKKFKSSVFAEFTDFETVDKFLTADPKPSFDGKELLVMSKAAYCDMKIKEKGLTGKAATHRRELLAKGRGFDAFRETAAGSSAASEDREILLEYIGNRIPIKKDKEGNGVVEEKDVPFVRGATLRFEGCGGDCQWSEIKDPIKALFNNKPPYIKFSRGDDFGLVGFHKALTEEEVEKVREAVKIINKNTVVWSVPGEEDEKKFQLERAQIAARTAVAQMSGGSSGRGGRGGGRGAGGRGRGGGGRGRGGRGGDRNSRNNEKRDAAGAGGAKAGAGGDAEVGEKRKRAVEPDGGPFTGVRGANAPPALGGAPAEKKAKTDAV